MLKRKLLLLSLFTGMAFTSLLAQGNVHVHGKVTDSNGAPVDSVNILVSVLYSDSSGVAESVYTDVNGTYAVDFSGPPLNTIGFVQASMVDCNGTVITQSFTVTPNGPFDIIADFNYCTQTFIDSCVVYILEEWNPGSVTGLTAWTNVNVQVEYLWSTGETTQSIYPDESGLYCVEVTFPWNCTPIPSDCYEFIVDSFGNCFAYIASTLNNDGSYTLEAISFGQAPFEYLWNTGETTNIIQTSAPGAYCVTVTDANGCEYATCSIIDDFNFCEVWIYNDSGGGLTAEGYGAPPFNYIWSTGESGQTIYPTTEGLYCVTATDQNECEASSCFYFGNFQDSCYVYVTAFFQDSNTFGLQAIPSTNAQSVSFLWSTGETGDIIYPQDPNQSYCVTMTDSDGCVATGCFDNYNWCYAWVDVQYLDTSTAVLSVYTDPILGWGGSNSATYLWSNGDTTSTITVTESGDYCVTVTLGPNCVTEACGYVDFEGLQNSCSAWVIQYQDSSGQWFAEALAWGYGTFEYVWTTGDTTPVIPIASANEFVCVTAISTFGCVTTACVDTFYNPCQVYIYVEYMSNTEAILKASAWNDPNQGGQFLWNTGQSGPVITVNTEGTYCVTVTGNGCTSEACIDVYFWNVDPCGVWISQEPAQSGVQFNANAWGIAPFSYLWSNGSTDSIQIIDFGPLDLCVTITDSYGCVASACTYPFDSCYIALWYYNNGVPQISIESANPLAYILWSTGDSLPVLEITQPGTYCVTVTDIYGCSAADCITIDSLIPSNGSTNVINGYVLSDPVLSLSGVVYAYSVSPNGGPFELVDSTSIIQGKYYEFRDLPGGLYIIKAVVDSGPNNIAEFLPTYHLSSSTWEEATPHAVPNWLPVTTDIWMIRIDSTNGPGVIGGVVTDPQHILAEQNGVYRGLGGTPGVVVLLKNQYGQALNYKISFEDGSFRFTGLPLGTYRVSYDIPGVHSPDVWVTLTAEDPERLEISLVLTEGSVAVDEPVSEEVELFPNPAKEEITIKVPGGNSTYHIELIDMQGKVVDAGSVKSLDGIMLIDVEQYSPGLYHINLMGDTKFYYGRFVKQE